MKKNIGILFPASRKMGVFQYALSIAEGLVNFSHGFNYTILYFGEESPEKFLAVKSFENIRFISLSGSANNLFGKFKLLVNILAKKPIFIVNKKNRVAFKSAGIDIIIIPFPSLFGFENKIPYIVSIPDVMHRFYPSFPEYNFKTRIKRDFVYGVSTKSAVFSVTDSEQGREQVHKFYKIDLKRIKPISYIPPGYIYKLKDMSETEANQILEKHKLPVDFLFYPAQFWFHKNHARLLRALYILKKEKGVEIPLVLSGNPGANSENYIKITDLIQELKMEGQIFILGYVRDKEVTALYKKSSALVFPTLLEPTNIPPLEAMILGKPVLCSFFRENKKQVKSAGVFFDPFDEKDIAAKIYRFWTDANLEKELILNSLKRAESISVKEFAKLWENVINDSLKIIEKNG